MPIPISIAILLYRFQPLGAEAVRGDEGIGGEGKTSGIKRRREGEAADRKEGRKVRARMEHKGGRKRKRGDG